MLNFIHKGSYLLVEVSGVYSLKFFTDSIHQIIAHSQKEKITTILVDIRNVDGDPSIMDRYNIGVEIAKHWSKNIQAAAVVREEVYQVLTENVAVNRGANFRVFTKMEAALKWLNVTNNE